MHNVAVSEAWSHVGRTRKHRSEYGTLMYTDWPKQNNVGWGRTAGRLVPKTAVRINLRDRSFGSLWDVSNALVAINSCYFCFHVGSSRLGRWSRYVKMVSTVKDSHGLYVAERNSPLKQGTNCTRNFQLAHVSSCIDNPQAENLGAT